MVEGYNIAFKVGEKTIAGRTQDDLNITPTTKESQTKDDKGNKNLIVVGHETTFSCQGLMEIKTAGPAVSTTKLYRDEVIALVLKKGEDAAISFVYSCEGGQSYKGKCVVTGYTESSNSEDTASWTINFKVTGAMEPAE